MFESERALPSPKLPQTPVLQKGLFTAAGLSLMGVTPSLLSPCQAAQAPEVTYEADKGSIWTLLLTNLGRCLGLTRPPASLASHGPGPGEGRVVGAGPGVRGAPQSVGSVCVQMDTCWSRMLNTSTGWCKYLGGGEWSEAREGALDPGKSCP